MTENGPQGRGHDDRGAGEIVQGALHGVVGAMAMTGMRAFTISAGLLKEPPPRAILRQKSRGLWPLAPRKKLRMAQELMHWGYGAAAAPSAGRR